MSDPALWDRCESLFAAALDRPEAEREAYVRAHADGPLARDVLSLLAHRARAEAAWGESALGWGERLLDNPDLQAGDAAGPYTLERLVGRGGVGSVWQARDAAGDRVAVKVLRRGLDTADVRHRFRQERHVLAALDHPGIARFLGSGVLGDGRPFVAMEFIDGAPIDAFCDARQLGVPERLALVRAVCDAVQHAHQRLVVHRDLKPSNILVAEGDGGAPRVTLLDFGIAKVLQPDDFGLSTLFTRPDAHALTPAYASPEQRTRGPVTTAADVYALGVVLHELLTGERPRHPTDAAEVPPMSQTLAGLPADRAEAAALARGTTAARLQRRLTGDLDRVVAMALRPEPERRYASAAQLADDIERHLAGVPVRARPSTARYRVGRFVRRHRAGVAAAVASVLLLAGFAATMAAERTRTAREAAKARAVADVLAGLFDAANPMISNGDTLTVHAVLRRAEPGLRADLAGQPEVLAEVLGVIGRAYRDQTDFARADPALRDALALHRRLDPRSDATATALGDLATLQFMRGDLGGALATARAHLALLERGANDLRRVPAIARIAAVHLQARRLDSARVWLDAGLALTRSHQAEHPDVHLQMVGLEGWYFAETGQPRASVRVAREILSLHRRTGAPLADVALAERILGDQCLQAGDLVCADTALSAAQTHYRTVFGVGSRYEALVLGHRADLAAARGQHVHADSLYRQALARRAEHFGPDSRETRTTREAYERHRTGAWGGPAR